jgi:murein DD-endopeptidase MepM/ murein hydrolase activator NlpD
MLANIKALIMGEEISEKEHKRDSLKVKPGEDVRSKSDSLLRNEIESQDKYQVKSSTSYADNADNLDGNHVYVNISDKGLPTDYLFYTPLKGKVISVFEPHKRHYGIDIAGSENAVIKSVYNGTVLFSDFTLKTGYIIAIQHPNNMISVYKHNSALLKHTGDVVRAGEPIAFIGNTGELTSGPHLHLELWYNGKAINPVEYISF